MTVGADVDHDALQGEVLALDPALRSPGIALFDRGELVAAGRVRVPKQTHALPILARCGHVAALCRAWYAEHSPNGREAPHAFAAEHPQVYRASRSKGDPNDLIGLAGVSGALLGMFFQASNEMQEGRRILSPTPAEWVGQLPKATRGDYWASPRGIQIRSVLSDAEFSRVEPGHDAGDAAGLGLWLLGRYPRRRTHARP